MAVPLLLVLAIALRLPNLDESLWFDEVAYSTHYRNPGLDGMRAFVMRIPGPPLYPVLAYVWVALVGNHEVIVRLPSLVSGLGSIVLTYLIARRFGRGGMPFLAALFLCLSPAHIWYSQEAAPYAMTMFFLLVAVFVWPLVTTSPVSRTPCAIYLVVLLAAVFTHYYAAVFLLPFTLLGLMAAKPVRYRILLANMVVILAFAAWLAVRNANRGDLPTPPGFLRAFTAFEWWMLFFQWFVDGNSLWTVAPDRMTPGYLLAEPWLLALQIVFAILVVRGLWPGRLKEPRVVAGELALHLCTLPLIVYLLTFVGRQQLYIERYLLICLPPFAIAIARGATRCSSATIRAGMVCAVIAVGVASYAAFLEKDSQWTVFKPNPDWRSAATFLGSQNSGPEHVLLVGGVPLADFMFYLSKQWPEQPRVREYTPPRLDRLRREGSAVQIVLVRNRFWRGDIDNKIARFQRNPRLQFTTRTSFKAVDLFIFVPRDGAGTVVAR